MYMRIKQIISEIRSAIDRFSAFFCVNIPVVIDSNLPGINEPILGT